MCVLAYRRVIHVDLRCRTSVFSSCGEVSAVGSVGNMETYLSEVE